jgi:peptidoglycan/LPS O-acetylase OafA/YrhL
LLQYSHRLETNNFDLLRLVFAATVCLVHAYQLSMYRQLAWIERVLSSGMAVNSFFIVSGFLIFMSFERSIDLSSYARKRFRRIYPAYFAIIMACAIGFVSISSKSATEYFSMAWLKYLAANLVFLGFLQPDLPGVFESNKFTAVNGALWTLKIEVLFYLSVPVMVLLFRKFGHLIGIALTYVLSVGYAYSCTWLAEETGSAMYIELGRQLPGQMCYFMAGAFFYYQLVFFKRHARYFLLGAVPVLVLNAYRAMPLLEPFALASVVIFFALFLHAGNFGKHGDFSYGIYILHFPIIQCFIHFGWLADQPWLFLVASMAMTALFAVALWHKVEKRFLSRGSHYVPLGKVCTNEC